MDEAHGDLIARSLGGAQLLSFFRDGRAHTRTEIIDATGWARKTVESRLAELMEQGLVRTAAAQHTGGRPSTSFELVPDARLVLAADLGHTHAALAITDLLGEVRVSERKSLDLEAGPRSVIEHVLGLAEALLESLGRQAADVAAVCVGLPSPVDHATGRALNPVGMHGWTDEDVRERIAEVFPGPVLVDNDVNLMAYGERAFVHPDADDLIFVKLATGLGAGVIAGGELQRGVQGFAGDIGHVPLMSSDQPCPCGNTGCVSLTASLPGLAASLRDGGRDIASDAEVIDLVAQGDPEAQRLLRQAGRDVGEVMVAAVGLLNPARLVIGGPWGAGLEVLIAGVRETVYGRGFALATRRLQIEASKAPEMAAIYGAAALAVEAAIGVRD